MITVTRMLSRGRSRRERVRGRLLATGAALATFLLCTAVNLLVFGRATRREHQPLITEGDLGDEQVVLITEVPLDHLGFLSEQEARLLTALTLALLVVPVAAFVHQVSRLATATRERRLAALRLAGATPREVRLLGAWEGGRRALLGGLSGIALYAAVNRALAWSLEGAVPLISPAQALAVLSAVTLGGTLSGLTAGRHVVTSPLGLVRRARPAGPRALDAALAASGTPGPALGRVLTRQALIAALPVCAVAAVAGTGVVVLTPADSYEPLPGALVLATARAALMAGIGVLAATLVARATRPILRGASRPEDLRDE